VVEKTTRQVLEEGIEILKANNIDNPILDAQIILGNILNIDKLHILIYPEKTVSEENRLDFLNQIKLRADGMPTQYIVGRQEFMNMEFEVNKDVLIPRPDTEILIEEIINRLDNDKEYNILDIGTGSGCISISLAKYLKKALVYTVDISEDATRVAVRNAKKNNVFDKIKFFNGNIFEPFKDESFQFDIIVSNPPYIPTKVIPTLSTNVKDYEPTLALDGGEDGLNFYREIIKNANKVLKHRGKIFFEIGYDQALSVKGLLEEGDYVDICEVKDLAGLDRVIKAVYNK
jgi:release factor glutamine methyltransferase